MNSTVLIKKCNSIQLGHLYEHIICIEIENRLRKRSLFSYSDYCLTGKTFHGGLVCVEFTQYRGRKINLIKFIENLNIKFTKELVLLGINQIMAEIEKPLTSTGTDNIIDALSVLHNKSWESAEYFGLHYSSDVQIEKEPLSIADGNLKSNKKLNVEITLNANISENYRQLIPLFRQIGYLLMINIENSICNDFGFFSKESSIIFSDNKHYSLKDEIYTGMAEPVLIGEINERISNLISEMRSSKVFNRFSKWLHNQSYGKGPQNHVSLENNYRDTLIFVGAKGWKSIASINDIEMILNNISFSVFYDN